ncbi:MAG: diguanylate cyclase [Dehalococcoidia bacterium]|uniref:diguanylate cyclase domain-containing protein n=1 Tax=Candidatus Amarobacter glycogenicus TaxID=3140699 RepID=UPI002A17530C|nr:diguanylate cyclase [Dehalococcoidia bacterium]MBK7125105.1 diguanylate cyclase [Dehalococcoidia bacterium]MBK9343462.1 diguanylate cyclase [Dehalococcoidia bacterium]MBK9610975.1 diguanylate cyclase [Dehalococcoidia bacterium]
MEPTVLWQPVREALRVLVIEDDPALGRLIQLVLGQHTNHVTVARSGAAAISAIRNQEFDAVASDISLPDVSGLDVIAEARSLAPAAGIVAITGFVDVDVAVRSMKAGADDFLGKPFDAEILWHMLNKAVDTRARQIEAEQAAVYRTLAYTDALTGSPNRRFIDEFIVEAVSNSQRLGKPLAVAYLDIDNFKLLNDFVGHEEGDHVLKKVATALTRHIGRPAQFARFGGDEFVVVFPECDEVRARQVMDRVCRAVSEIEVINGARISLPTRISCGIAEFRGFESPRDLIAEAEDQMYLDKSMSPASVLGQAGDEPADGLLKVSNLKALRNLVKAIDRRDSYTRFHSDHATQLALAVARSAGLDDTQVNAIAIGGPIHDLGKIVVADEILRKPGPLTLDERRSMEEHPLLGAAITAAVTDYDSVVDLVRHHHERIDGDGYPGRLKGLEISAPTRLFTLADAYSAMTTDRPYRKGFSPERAIDEIHKGSGTQFDPDFAVAFVDLIERMYQEAAA